MSKSSATTPAPSAMTADLIDALQRLCTHEKRTSAQIDADWDYARSVLARTSQPVAAAPVEGDPFANVQVFKMAKPEVGHHTITTGEFIRLSDERAALQQRQAPADANPAVTMQGCQIIGENADGTPALVMEGEGFIKKVKEVRLIGWKLIGPSAQQAEAAPVARYDREQQVADWLYKHTNLSAESSAKAAAGLRPLLVSQAAPVASAEPVTDEQQEKCPPPFAAPASQLDADSVKKELMRKISRYSNALSNEVIYGESETASMKRCREYAAKTAAAHQEIAALVDQMELAGAAKGGGDIKEVSNLASPSPHPVSIGAGDEATALRTWPAEIYLSTGEDDELLPFDSYHEISWCDHPTNTVDVRYVRADLAHPSAEGGAAEAKDAARYRWLRDVDFSDAPTSEIRGKPWAVYLQSNQQIPTMVPCRGHALDHAVDAALAATPSTQQETDK